MKTNSYYFQNWMVLIIIFQTLAEYWLNKYDWRSQEKMLNQFPQFKTTLDGLDIHFIHLKPGKTRLPKSLFISFCGVNNFLNSCFNPDYISNKILNSRSCEVKGQNGFAAADGARLAGLGGRVCQDFADAHVAKVRLT